MKAKLPSHSHRRLKTKTKAHVVPLQQLIDDLLKLAIEGAARRKRHVVRRR